MPPLGIQEIFNAATAAGMEEKIFNAAAKVGVLISIDKKANQLWLDFSKAAKHYAQRLDFSYTAFCEELLNIILFFEPTAYVETWYKFCVPEDMRIPADEILEDAIRMEEKLQELYIELMEEKLQELYDKLSKSMANV